MTKRQISEHANAARQIRKVLRDIFPETKFSVRSESYSGGSSVNIKWTNGPSEEQVRDYVFPFQYGHFDGMIDLYEYSNVNDDLPQVKFVMTNRELNRDFIVRAANSIADSMADDIPKVASVDDLGNSFEHNGYYVNHYQLVWQYTCKLDLTGVVDLKLKENFCGSPHEIFEGVTA